MSRRTMMAGFVALALALAASSADAFRMIQQPLPGRWTAGLRVSCNNPFGFAHWPDANISFHHNTSGQGSGKNAALQNAMATWTAVSGSDYVLTYAGTTTAGFVTDDRNTLVWASGQGCSGNCLALTALVLDLGQVIREADVVFNPSFTWNTNGADHDTEAVAVHELGHTLGIHHTELTSFPRPTMYATYFGPDARSLEHDDREAARCIQQVFPPLPGGGGGGGGGGEPDPPPTVRVRSEHCLGAVTVDWDSVAGATRYELRQSPNSHFSGDFEVYDGPALRKFLDAGRGTWWFRVRACTGNDCGDYRNGDRSFTYERNCQ